MNIPHFLRPDQSLISCRWALAWTFLFLALCLSDIASAQTLISDTFSRSGSLAGSTPDTSPGGETWSTYLSAGSGTATMSGSLLNFSSTASAGNTSDEVASLGFTPAANAIYTLSATITATSSTSGGYIGLGFAGNSMGALGGQGYDWQFIQTTGNIATYLGPGTSNPASGASPGSTTAVLQIVLNTSANTVSFYEGSSMGSLTLEGSSAYSVSGQTTNEVFLDVHSAYNGGAGGNMVGTIDNFTLTEVVPEPSTFALFAVGLGLVAAMKGLRRIRSS